MSTNRTTDGRSLPTFTASSLGDTENGDRLSGLVNFLWTGGAYARQRHAFDGVPGTGVAAVGQVAYGSNAQFNAQNAASATTDTDVGHKFMPAAGMLWNGTTWQRARAPYSETIIASAARTAPDASLYSASSPVINSYEFSRVLLVLNVTAVSGAPGTGEGLSIKVSNGASFTVVAQATGDTNVFKATGRYGIVLGPGAAAATGPAAQVMPSAINGAAPEQPVIYAPSPLPPRYQFTVYHRGGSLLTWTYSVDAYYSH